MRYYIFLIFIFFTFIGYAQSSHSTQGIAFDTNPRTVLELRHGEGNCRNSEGDFIRLNDGRILFAYSKYLNGTGDDYDSCVIACRISSDEGETWSNEDRIIAENTVEPGGNVMSVSFLRLDQKRIAMFYLRKIHDKNSAVQSQIIMKVTSNDGKTWSKEMEVTAGTPLSYRVVNNARIIRLKSGRVLIPVHGPEMVDGKAINENRPVLFCYYSDDNCKTWHQSEYLRVYDMEGKRIITQEPGVIELSDGNVLMYIRTWSDYQWYAYSNDGGITWGGAQKSRLQSPVAPATFLRLKNGEIMGIWNNQEGHEDYASYNDGPGREGYGVRTPLTIGLSFDEGETWKYVRNIEDKYDKDDVHHYWYCYTAAMELDDCILLSYCAENALKDSRIVKVPKALLKQRPELCIRSAMVEDNADVRETIAHNFTILSEDEWYGFHRIKFEFEGHTAWVVEPRKSGISTFGTRPWTWTMQWADSFVNRTGVLDLLEEGYHHVTIEAFDTRADEQGIKMFADFQKFLVEKLGFESKANLVGMSWGGFFSIRYANAYPQNVRRIYLDAPLLNFQEWDADKVERVGPWASCPPSDGCWEKDPRMPLNMAENIAGVGIPILLLYGGQDQSVNPKLNCEPFIERFKAAGGKAVVECRGGFGHHPHGVDSNETEIITKFFKK